MGWSWVRHLIDVYTLACAHIGCVGQFDSCAVCCQLSITPRARVQAGPRTRNASCRRDQKPYKAKRTAKGDRVRPTPVREPAAREAKPYEVRYSTAVATRVVARRSRLAGSRLTLTVSRTEAVSCTVRTVQVPFMCVYARRPWRRRESRDSRLHASVRILQGKKYGDTRRTP